MSLPTTPLEIIECLSKHWEVETDKALAEHIGVKPNQLGQAKNATRMGIKDKIIVSLLTDLQYLVTENERLKQYAPKPKQADSDPYIDAMNKREMEKVLG